MVGLCATVRRMDFNELVALLREPGEDGLPESIYDDLTSSYQLAVDGGAASVAERDASIAEKDAEIARLKALNFDLLMAAGETTTTDDNDNAESDLVDEPTIDDLFDKD